MKKLLPALAVLLLASPFSGCKKEKSEALTPDEEKAVVLASTQSESESELVFNDVFDNVLGVNSEVGIGGTGVFGRVANLSGGREQGLDTVPSCLTVTVVRLNQPAPFPVRITLDFGTGCTGTDGHTRSGKIITTYSGRLVEPGKTAVTHFENFKIDSFAVQGEHKIANTTLPGGNQTQFTVDVTDGKLTRPSGDYTLWTSHRVITRTEGNGTPLPGDDVFSITGNGHGRVLRGNLIYAWQSEIFEPLIKRFTCHWISRGVLRIRRETLPTSSPWVATLNYGQGTCDFVASLTVNGVTTTVLLPH